MRCDLSFKYSNAAVYLHIMHTYMVYRYNNLITTQSDSRILGTVPTDLPLVLECLEQLFQPPSPSPRQRLSWDMEKTQGSLWGR